MKPFICDYFDAYILATGDRTVIGNDNNTNAAFKNCEHFKNDEHLNTCENLDLIINMYNLIEYSGNYADSTASLYHFQRQEQNYNNNGAIDNISTASP